MQRTERWRGHQHPAALPRLPQRPDSRRRCRISQVVDPDRVSNPHGEHALEAYRLLEPLETLQQGRQQQDEQQQDAQQQQENAP